MKVATSSTASAGPVYYEPNLMLAPSLPAAGLASTQNHQQSSVFWVHQEQPVLYKQHSSEDTLRCSWDIKDAVLPRVKICDEFQLWPDGHCRLVYEKSNLTSEHKSGWAMRNTNNHDRRVLKKSCVGVMRCTLNCRYEDGLPRYHRPGICDKARTGHIGTACPNPLCKDGVLEQVACRGQGGNFPVTHFWRTEGDRVYFHAKGVHDHPRPSLKTFRRKRAQVSVLQVENGATPMSSRKSNKKAKYDSQPAVLCESSCQSTFPVSNSIQMDSHGLVKEELPSPNYPLQFQAHSVATPLFETGESRSTPGYDAKLRVPSSSSWCRSTFEPIVATDSLDQHPELSTPDHNCFKSPAEFTSCILNLKVNPSVGDMSKSVTSFSHSHHGAPCCPVLPANDSNTSIPQFGSPNTTVITRTPSVSNVPQFSPTWYEAPTSSLFAQHNKEPHRTHFMFPPSIPGLSLPPGFNGLPPSSCSYGSSSWNPPQFPIMYPSFHMANSALTADSRQAQPQTIPSLQLPSSSNNQSFWSPLQHSYSGNYCARDTDGSLSSVPQQQGLSSWNFLG